MTLISGQSKSLIIRRRCQTTSNEPAFCAETPEIAVPQVRLHRAGETVVLIEDYVPAGYMRGLLA